MFHTISTKIILKVLAVIIGLHLYLLFASPDSGFHEHTSCTRTALGNPTVYDCGRQ